MGTKGTCIIYLERYHIALQHALIPARVTISTKSYQIKELYNYFIIAREGIQSAVLKDSGMFRRGWVWAAGEPGGLVRELLQESRAGVMASETRRVAVGIHSTKQFKVHWRTKVPALMKLTF